MYNTKTAVVNTGSSYIEAGINDNIILKEVNVKKSPTNKDFIEFIFEDENGKVATMTEWKNEKNMWIKTDEDLQRRDDLQFGRILQIISCYLETIPEATFDSFSGMINWAKTTLDNIQEKEKQPLRLKVVYDKNNYTKVSTNGIFVESMFIKTSQIKKLSRDNFERQVVADVETQSAPFGSSNETISVSGADDLPF